MSDKTNEQRDIEIAEAMLQKGICPFDGKHFSSASRAACPVCNPEPPKDRGGLMESLVRRFG
jgi:hypothetical protein